MYLSQDLFKKTAVASAIVLALGQAAEAAIINAEVNYTTGTVTGSAIDGPANAGSVDVLGSDQDGNSNIFYHTYGSTTGDFGSRVSGRGTYDITGTFTYTDTIINSSAGSLGYDFNFTVTAGQLALAGTPVDVGESLMAEYSIDILVNGSSIWDSAARLQQNGNQADAIFSELGTYSLGGALSIAGANDQYSWGDIDNSISLGTLAGGESMTFEYILTSRAVGSVSDANCVVSDDGFDGAERWFSSPCGSIARSGDPFYFGAGGNQNTGIIAISQLDDPTKVSEPTSLVLMGLGLAGLGAASRRRRKQ